MANNKFFKKIILTLFCIVLIFSMISGSLNIYYADTNDNPLEHADTDINSDDAIVIENNKFKLTFLKNKGTFILFDKFNNTEWNSSIADNSSDDVANGRERMNMASVMVLTYLDEVKDVVGYINTATGATTLDSNGNTVANIKVQTKKNSMLIYYIFKEIQSVVPLELTIDENGLRCSVLSKEIVENSDFKILSISLLPYFGATKETDGYLLLPDGSGALAYFDGGNKNYEPYKAQVYGRDECLDILMDTEKVQTVRMPIFGMNRGDSGFFGIITEGDAEAFITASVAGQTSTYSRISPEFTVRSQDSYTMGESNGNKAPQTVSVYEKKALSNSKDHAVEYEITDFSVQYYILGSSDCDYSGMAHIYREYLLQNSNFSEIENRPTVHIELPGAVRKTNKIFGINVYSTKVLNDDEDIENIIKTLNKNGVDNIDIKYTEWTKQQIKNQVNDNAKINTSLGSKKSINNLIEKYSDNVDFYFDSDFYETENIQLNYKLKNIFSYNVSGKKTLKYGYELENYLRSPYIQPLNLISPTVMSKLANKFSNSMKFDEGKISVSKISSLLSSDFKEEGYTRTNSKKDVEKAIGILAKNKKIMISGGNSYALPFADSVIDAPESGSNYDFADISVPFYQLVVSGLMTYSYQPMNSNTDAKTLFLKSVETGAALHFYFVSQNSEHLPDTQEYTKYTSINPDDWYEEISDYYLKLKEIYEATKGTRMVSHKVIFKNVNETSFENGCKIVTNYSKGSFDYNGIEVLANSYAIVSRGN